MAAALCSTQARALERLATGRDRHGSCSTCPAAAAAAAAATPLRHMRRARLSRPTLGAPRQPAHSARGTSTAAAAGGGLPELQAVLQQASAAHPGWLAGAAVNTAVFIAGAPVLLKGLTGVGMVNAYLLGTTVFAAFGLGGFALVCAYFLFGTAVTKVKLEQKQKEGIAEARSGRRGPGSVWGSGSAGVFCALMALLTGDYSLWQVGFVACFTSKLSDTVSSEIGKAYGRTTYLITTLQLVPRGTEGAVSLEGTLAGLLAAAVYAGLALALGQANTADAATITGAAFVANVFESYLGAAVQGRVGWLNNDIVNVIQITVAAALAVTAKHYLYL